MGLKNKIYEINGYFYPEVYAVFNGKVQKSGNSFVVGFDIHASRELALTKQPLKSVNVVVSNWDRQSNLIALAYQKGKEQLEDWQYDINGKPQTILIDNVFTGWQDDKR